MSVFSATDHAYMARALRLAQQGLYTTQPNPRVGCVIARDGKIVGEGWHQRAGEPHAEVFALGDAGERARGATAYVTLEPCSHFGRTPPCADALIAAGIGRVVAASEDSDPKVSGDGLAKLCAAGIAVETGLMREAARDLNRGFFARVERGRPWLRLKLAMSLDGRTALANGESKWITGAAARADVQRWRARSSAIMTGSGTVLADNPRLTVRLASLPPPEEGSAQRRMREEPDTVETASLSDKSFPYLPAAHPLPEGEGKTTPLRVVLDHDLRTPLAAHVLDGRAPTLIYYAPGAIGNRNVFEFVECKAISENFGRLDLKAVLCDLAARGMNEVQVEAGPTLCGALLQSGFVDELLLYIAPVLLGDKARPLLVLPELREMTQARRLRVTDQRQIGEDLRIIYRE